MKTFGVESSFPITTNSGGVLLAIFEKFVNLSQNKGLMKMSIYDKRIN